MAFSDGEARLLIDAYLSRPPVGNILLEPLRSNADVIARILRRAGLEKLDALAVSHSHFDHALDAASVARVTGALLYGTATTANIALGERFPVERIRALHDNASFEVGGISVQAFESPHSPGMVFAGTIDTPLRTPARVPAYREGGSRSFLLRAHGKSMIVVPSANFTPGRLRGVTADVVFLSAGALGIQAPSFIEEYWNEVVGASGARKVVLIHWDDFTRPLSAGLRPFPRFVDEFPTALEALSRLAARDRVDLVVPRAFDVIDSD